VRAATVAKQNMAIIRSFDEVFHRVTGPLDVELLIPAGPVARRL
jgi:hypothetical protein